MKTGLLTGCFFLLLTFSFCKKDKNSDDNTTPTGSTIVEVRAGMYDSSFIYHEFSPDFEIHITWDSLNLYGSGNDSIDLDTNGSYDLFIALSLLNHDSIHLLQGMPNPFPYCRIVTKNGFEVAIYKETYPIGLGQTQTANFVDTLSYGDKVSQVSYWHHETSSIAMWNENPGGAGLPSFGAWHYMDSVKYIGIRMNNKYGWIEIDASDYESPVIIRYAVRK